MRHDPVVIKRRFHRFFAHLGRHCGCTKVFFLLERILQVAYLDLGPVELINVSVSGYTSEQVKRLLDDRLWDYGIDLTLLYCGNNDASISGSLSDRELFQAQKLPGLRRALGEEAERLENVRGVGYMWRG